MNIVNTICSHEISKKMYFVELNFDILIDIVDTISSIYSFDIFSRIQVKT